MPYNIHEEDDFDHDEYDDYDDDYDIDDEQESVLLPCPLCGAEIYEDAELCPYCGNYVSMAGPSSTQPTWIITTAAILLIIFVLGLLGLRGAAII